MSTRGPGDIPLSGFLSIEFSCYERCTEIRCIGEGRQSLLRAQRALSCKWMRLSNLRTALSREAKRSSVRSGDHGPCCLRYRPIGRWSDRAIDRKYRPLPPPLPNGREAKRLIGRAVDRANGALAAAVCGRVAGCPIGRLAGSTAVIAAAVTAIFSAADTVVNTATSTATTMDAAAIRYIS